MDKPNFSDKKEWRKFGLGVAAILSGIATIQIIKSNPLYIWFYSIGGFFLVTGLLVPVLLKPVYILFSYLGLVLGWIMTRIILSVLFFIILTPIAWISRLTGKRHLIMRPEPELDTYWIPAEKRESTAKEFERQF